MGGKLPRPLFCVTSAVPAGVASVPSAEMDRGGCAREFAPTDGRPGQWHPLSLLHKDTGPQGVFS